MAEALFGTKVRELNKSDVIEVQSAGIYKFKGFPVSPHAITVLAEYGIKYEREPQGINTQLIEWTDLVLTMTKFHKHIAIALFPEIFNKTFTLKEFVGNQNSLNISDPVGKSLSTYPQCAQEIDSALNLLQHKLQIVSETSFSSFIFPTPQPLPPAISLLRWLIRLRRLRNNTRH